MADPHDATGLTVYATVMGFAGNGLNAAHLYRSLNGGSTWTNISSNLPNAPANSVAVDPNDANTVYIALDTGVYVATQVATCAAANCWSILGTGLPNAPVIDLVASAGVATGDGRLGELRAATYGRGVWQIPLLTAINNTPQQPAITLTPATLTFAAQPVATASPAQTVTVSNTGNAPLTISGITTTGDFDETDTCTAASSNTLAPAATCTVQVTFLPSATGARTGVLTVFGNVPGGQATVTLNGTATPPAAIVLNPIAVVFPTTSVGATSAPINITISNTGGTTATLQTPTITGTDFKLTANTCTATLPSQVGCTVSVVFAPTVSGPRSGTFTITDSAGTQTASLNGAATSPATDSLAPLTLTFAPQVLNTTSPTQTVTLTNSGDVPLTLIAAQITSGDFTVVNACGNSLNGHSSCTLNVAYVPKSVGANAGTLTVSDQFRNQTVALNGTGLPPAGVSLSPFAAIAFPITAVGVTSQSVTVTLTNNGGVPLSIQGATITGDFLIVPTTNTCPTTLAPATACIVQIAFAPTLGGPRTGTLAFADSAANSPQSLALTGTGVDFTLTANGPTTISIASGASAVFPFLLTSAPGTPGIAAFTCLGAPANATCTVIPQNPTLGGTTTIAVTIATGVATTISSSHPAPGLPKLHDRSAPPALPGMLWLSTALPFGVLAFRRRRSISRQSRLPKLTAVGLILLTAAFPILPALRLWRRPCHPGFHRGQCLRLHNAHPERLLQHCRLRHQRRPYPHRQRHPHRAIDRLSHTPRRHSTRPGPLEVIPT